MTSTATFPTPILVKVEKTPMDAVFDGGGHGSCEGVALAVSFREPSFFRDGATHYLVVVADGASGWVKAEYCKLVGVK